MSETVSVVEPRANVVVLEEQCKACELCVVSCPQGNLKLSARLNHAGFHPAEFTFRGEKGECTACGVCYWVCPDFAISEVKVKA